jgi:hypothetical protein
VLVKLVSKSLTDKKFASAEGVAVARVVAVDDVSLPANGKVVKDFSLLLSENLPSGIYELEAAYVLSREYNLENPDFDFIGSQNMALESLEIHNDASSSFAFVNGKGLMTKGKSLSASLENPSASDAVAVILWKIYSWNALSEKAVVESVVESVKVPAGGKKTVSYEIRDNEHSLYQAVLQTDSNGMRSIATALVETSIGETIIKLAGVTPFPSQEGVVQAYACLHNVYSDDKTPRSVHLALFDSSGKLLGEGTFPAPMGTNEFEVSKLVKVNGGDISLTASVISSGALAQVVERTFRCDDFGGCSASGGGTDIDYLFALTLLAAGTGGLVTMRYYLKHHRHKTAEAPSNIPN